MTIDDIQIGDKVVYIPKHLLIADTHDIIKTENLGVVTSLNDTYVFVRYKGKSHSQATKPEDLFSLKNRPDLADQIINS
jgi:hypothetical protein